MSQSKAWCCIWSILSICSVADAYDMLTTADPVQKFQSHPSSQAGKKRSGACKYNKYMEMVAV